MKDQVRRTLISESYEQAVEKNKLQVIGEPEFDNAEAIKLPEDGPLSYSFQVEVQPEITLPDLTGLKVKKPKIDINEENVDQAMQNLREQQGTLVPVEDRGVEEKDYLIADVHVKTGRQRRSPTSTTRRSSPARAASRASRSTTSTSSSKGLKPGETRTIKVKAPETHPQRSRSAARTSRSRSRSRTSSGSSWPRSTQEFLERPRLRERAGAARRLREQMVERIDYDVQQAMREQVNKYLLENVHDRAADASCQRPAGGPRRQPPGGGPDDARHAARAGRGATSSGSAAAPRTRRSAS